MGTRGLADRITQIYERYAVEWDADRNGARWIDKPWHERFAASLVEQACVLDLGCGTGMPVAWNLLRHGHRITGVDASPAMISICRDRMPEQEWIVSDMRVVGLNRDFDGILAWDSFFFLPPEDQQNIFKLFADHAACGALLMFNTGPRRGESIGQYRGEPLYHASLDAGEYEALLARAGFGVLAHSIEDPEAGGRTVWLARFAGGVRGDNSGAGGRSIAVSGANSMSRATVAGSRSERLQDHIQRILDSPLRVVIGREACDKFAQPIDANCGEVEGIEPVAFTLD